MHAGQRDARVSLACEIEISHFNDHSVPGRRSAVPPCWRRPYRIVCSSTDCRLSEENAAALYTGMSSVKLARVCQKFAGLISFDAAVALRGRLTVRCLGQPSSSTEPHRVPLAATVREVYAQRGLSCLMSIGIALRLGGPEEKEAIKDVMDDMRGRRRCNEKERRAEADKKSWLVRHYSVLWRMVRLQFRLQILGRNEEARPLRTRPGFSVSRAHRPNDS